MIKPTPNPPETDPTSPYETLDSKKFHEAAERALDHYLNPLLPRKPLLKPNTRYLIAPGIPSEELLADACETLTSAKTMASDFAGMIEAPQRHVLLGIGQLIMLAELAVNRVLDNLDVAAEPRV
ncbi:MULTISPECIES: DUF6124 family protein [Pseudomonas]|uniref:DUF6124 family protein n=1 Tax=Pseudomonas TaxID=286 RepID=UPI000A1EC753|nr:MULTISPECIES: DUF6124 family protein [Pseudomonas]MCX4219052.1 DUF6124 family protein [Pseudomonas sp. MCal1]UDI95046.1 hypothetical protein I5961_11160 [Pseudomonas sp. IAC-BECa141]UIN53314.1 DUF6124 family protein [Pseudomonas kribbensis]